MSSIARRYGELERPELIPEVVSYALYSLLFLILLGGVWAVVGSIDVVAVAPATAVPVGEVKLIQPEVDGVIESVMAVEGQHVTAGDVLAVLEKTASKTELEQGESRLAIVEEKLRALVQAKETLQQAISNPSLPPANAIDVEGVALAIADLNAAYITLREAQIDRSMFSDGSMTDMSALSSQTNSLQEQRILQCSALKERVNEHKAQAAQKRIEVEQLLTAIASAKVELGQAQLILEASQQQEESLKKVFQEGAVSRVDYLNTVKELERARRDVTRQTAVIDELIKKESIAESQLREFESKNIAAIAEKKAQLKCIDLESGRIGLLTRGVSRKYATALASFDSAKAKVCAALKRVESNLKEESEIFNQAKSHLTAAHYKLSTAEIKSPVAGRVTGIKLRGRGHVVKRGERLMAVVPDNATFVFEARIANKDAGFVEKGQLAKLKLASYPFEDFGVLDGQVAHLEASGEMTPGTQPVFVARVAPKRQFIMARGRARPLVSGMSATCEIITRRRSILSILVEPIAKLNETRWH
ncbi:MAG: HlyD family efflux transporter periplasmic adaptor subunit [Candidatus Obscuribacterales bacterium]|nr:HlyD family efflux transporter periplasmic adaptor subunit [Candidatus Obscuribacterales bacterium]